MSLFVAGFPPDGAVADLRDRVADLRVWRTAGQRRPARVAAPQSWHVTLAFLGELPPDRRPAVQNAVGTAVIDWATGAAGPPVVRLAGGGRFGTGRSTVLWVGVLDLTGELTRLVAALRRQLAGAGLPVDERPFRGHLTVARPGDRLPATDLDADLARLADYAGPPWTLDPVELLASKPPGTEAYQHLWAHPTHPA